MLFVILACVPYIVVGQVMVTMREYTLDHCCWQTYGTVLATYMEVRVIFTDTTYSWKLFKDTHCFQLQMYVFVAYLITVLTKKLRGIQFTSRRYYSLCSAFIRQEYHNFVRIGKLVRQKQGTYSKTKQHFNI